MSDLWTEPQKRNIAYFDKNIEALLQDELMRGKFVVIHEETIKGAYDTFEAALQYALLNFSKNEFVIQQIIDKKDIIGFLRLAVN